MKINMHLWGIVHIVINVTTLEMSISAFGKTVVDSIHPKQEKRPHYYWTISFLKDKSVSNALNTEMDIFRSVANVKEIQLNATCSIKFYDKYKAATTAPIYIQIHRVKNNLENMSHIHKLP